MAAVTLLGSATFTTASGTKTVTATPAVNDLIVIITEHTGNTSAATPTDDQSGTYVEITSAVKNAGADTMRIFIRTALISSAVSTVFTHAPGASTGGGLTVLKVTGMTRTGASAARQSGKQDNQAANTAPTVTFGAAMLNANAVIGAVFNASNPAAITPPAAYIELVDTGYDTPTTGVEVVSHDANNGVTTVTWGTSITAYGSLAVELDTSSAGYTMAAGSGAFTLAGTAASLSTGFHPAALFAGTEAGGWYDPSDLSTLWQDTAGTIAVTTAGQSVARIDDKSGNANHLIQATAARQPTYQVDASGNAYLSFDGVDDVLGLASLTIALPFDRLTALRQVSWTINEYVWWGGANTAWLYQNATTPELRLLTGGTGNLRNSALAVGSNGVVIERHIAGASKLAINDGAYAGPVDIGSTAPTNMYLGATSAAGAASNIRFYGAIVRDQLTDADLANARNWLANRAGLYKITAASGSFALTGTDVLLKKAWLFTVGAGSFVLTGADVVFRRGYGMVADAAAFVLTGTDITIRRTYIMAAAAGSFVLTGTDALLKRAYSMVAGGAAFVLRFTELLANKERTFLRNRRRRRKTVDYGMAIKRNIRG